MRLLIAGHSFSFCAPIAQRAKQSGAEVRTDRWLSHGAHDEAASAAALEWAEVVHCEWCLGNAVWFSRAKRPGQRLVVRFHRMELDTDYPGELDLEGVDAMVFVAQHVLAQACERYGWDADDRRLQVIPNGIDLHRLSAPKLPDARFTLAMIGYVPQLKRLDRALDTIDLLRARDDRYRLLVKGRAPWEYEWMTGRDEERRYFTDQLRRVRRSPNLRRAVSFEPFDDDMPSFLRRVGWVLSTSEVEGHSVALAEGMASGAVPVVIDRPGAGEQYEARWVHADADAAARAISPLREGPRSRHRIDFGPLAEAVSLPRDHGAEGEAARELAAAWDWERLWPAWDELLLPEPAGV